MPQIKRVEICGGIASGKTTLAKLMEQNDLGLAVYENFQANPFWKAFYENPGKFIFETEVAFTLQHYHEIKKAYEINSIDNVICDNSFLLDLAYAKIGLNGNKLDIYKKLLIELIKDIGEADLIVALKCGPEEELKRIRQRNREVEQSINITFLESLNQELSILLENNNSRLLLIDSQKYNFASSDSDRTKVLDMLKIYCNNT